MADSSTGLTKTTDTSSSLNLEISTLKELKKTLEKSLKTIDKKISESNRLDEKERLVMDSAYEKLNKQVGEIGTFLERYNKAVKSYGSLTDSQRKIIFSSLQEDMGLVLRHTEKIPESLSDFSVLLKNVKGGKSFQKLVSEIETISKNAKVTAENNKKLAETIDKSEAKKAKASKKELLRDSSLKTSEENWYDPFSSLGKNLLKTTITGTLGPLSALLKPVSGFLSKEYSILSKNASQRVRIISSPTEASILNNGGNEGKIAIWQTREMKKALGVGGSSSIGLLGDKDEDDKGFFDKLKDTITVVLGLSAGEGLWGALKTAVPGLVSATGFLAGAAAVGGIALTSFLGISAWKAFTGGFKDSFKDAWSEIEALKKEDLDSDGNGRVSPEEIAAKIKEIVKENVSRTDAAGKAFSEVREDPLGALAAVLTLGGSERAEETWTATGEVLKTLEQDYYQNHENLNLFAYLLGTMAERAAQQGDWDAYDTYLRQQENLKYRYANDADLYMKFLGSKPDISGGFPRFYDPEDAEMRRQNFMNSDYYRNNLYKTFLERYGEFVNDAVIYKDNSVYVPHPDDNIILTKDGVTTSVLSESFEETLFNTLDRIIRESKSSVVSIQTAPNNFDFSALRV